jgi:uncharacterized protein YjbI with pentapeptide repeats
MKNKNKKIMTGGVDSDSPRTKSIKKIQSSARGRITRQTKKAEKFSEVLSTGAATYKKRLSTMDLKGINLKDAILSRRVLNKLNLQNIKFENTKLNGTKLIETNLSGSTFSNTIMKKADFTDANCSKCKFNNCDMEGSNFTNANMQKCFLNYCTLFNANFSNTDFRGSEIKIVDIGNGTNFSGAKLDNCILYSMIFFENRYLNHEKQENFTNITIDYTNNGEIPSLSIPLFTYPLKNLSFTTCLFKKLNLKSSKHSAKILERCIFSKSVFENFAGPFTIYSNCQFLECKMKKAIFTQSNIGLSRISECDLEGSNFLGCLFNKSQIMNNNMSKCNFTVARGLNNIIIHTTNFTSASFNGTNLSKTTFSGCNLQGVQFIPILPAGAQGDFQQIPSDLTNTIFIECKMQSITFQNTLGLQGRNFQGQDLRRCTFSGCDLTGTIFRDCNLSECVFTNAFITDTDFTDSIRENTVFDGAIGREQNETLTPEERGIQVEGANNDIPAIYPTDVHAAFRIIKKNDYYNTIISYIDNWQRFENYINTVNNNQSFVQHIDNEIINVMIRDDVKENKDLIIKYKDKCINERLKFYNYKDNIVSGSNPRISWMKFLFATLVYVFNQNDEFIELYITDVIMESATTYGEGGLSCDRGINERFIIKLRNTMYMMMDFPEIKNNIDKIIEYNTILNTIDPTKTLPTTKEEIQAEREKPEKEYKDFTVSQELRDKWYEIHSSEGGDPFDDDTSIDEAISSYTIFLKDNFKYVSLDKEDKERYDREMKDELNKMRQLLDEGAGMTYLFLGGRKMYGGKKIWNMDKKQFRSLCKKIFGKSKCKKIRNTKKLKKIKNKSTRRKG